MWHHRAIMFLSVAAFFLVPHIDALALDTLQGITPPTLKSTLPSVQTPVVKPGVQAACAGNIRGYREETGDDVLYVWNTRPRE